MISDERREEWGLDEGHVTYPNTPPQRAPSPMTQQEQDKGTV